MGKRDTRVEEYIAGRPAYARPILRRLRAWVHRACPDARETIKWGTPHFERHGLLAGMAAFKAHVSFHLWRGKELEDPAGLFADVGRSQMAAIKVRSTADLPDEAVLCDYLRRAAALDDTYAARPGTVRRKEAAAKRRPAPPVPSDLAAALARDAEARRTFARFPPSAQRDYIEWITGAKREATRAKRLATTLAWLAEGKRRNWEYESC